MERTREGIRLDTARAYAQANRLNKVESFGTIPKLGLIAAGQTYLDLRQALRILGLDEAGLRAAGVRLLRLAMIHPLIPSEIAGFADGLDEIMVVEEKRSFVESAVRQILYGTPSAPRVTGKTTPEGTALFAADGVLDADSIAAGLTRRLAHRPGFALVAAWQAARAPQRTPALLPLVTRTPYFCSGCPHNSSTKVPQGLVVGAGIGCHSLVLMMTPDTIGDVIGLTQMGGEGAQWIGMAPFLKDGMHLLQNIGDGTFLHSGSLAVRAAVAAGVNVTYKLLYNSAVAMTGGQQAEGAMPIPALTRMLLAEGVRRIIVTTDQVSRYRGVRLGAERASLASRPAYGGPGGTEPGARGHGPHPRPGMRDGIAAQAQARLGARPCRVDHDQRAHLRGMRRLRREVELPVRPARRHRLRPQDRHRPVVLQQGLLLRGRRLPLVRVGRS